MNLRYVGRVCVWLGVLVWAGAFCCRPLSAEVTSLTLPHEFADFAIDPESGDLAAVAAETNAAYFFSGAELAKGNVEPAAKLNVGATPCSVFFKQFEDQRLFAIVCSQDSHMFLVEAAAPFKQVAKIDLIESGVSLVTGSINPQDPYLYYCYGSGHGSSTGVVNLRDRKNHGKAFDDSMDCAISADGDVAYRRGPWSPSGFESLSRTTPLSAAKPEFTRLFRDHVSTSGYVPDPFNRYTATGKGIYNLSLDKKEAGLAYSHTAFFRTRPLIVGLERDTRFGVSRSGKDTERIYVASYNTFTPTGARVTLPHKISGDDSNLPRGIPSQADFKRITKQPRLFADDARSQVVFAERNLLHYVPLTDFEDLPDEPFLMAELAGADALLVEQEAKLTLKPKDPRATVTINDKPVGMTVDGETLTWTPADDQIGAATILATVSSDEIQRTLRFDLEINYPSTLLPFSAAGIAVDPAGKLAILWTAPPSRNRPIRMDDAGPAEPLQLAVLDLATGKVKISRPIAEPIGELALAGDAIVLTTAGGNSPRCEILNLDDLQRTKSIVAGGPIVQIKVVDQILFLQTPTSVEAYSLANFERKAEFSTKNSATTPLTDEGIFAEGVLYGYDLQPKLIVHAGTLARLGDSRNMALPPFLRDQGLNNHMSPRARASQRGLSADVPDSDVSVRVETRNQVRSVPGAAHTMRTETELAIVASGSVDARQVLMRKFASGRLGGSTESPTPVLAVTSDNALVVLEQQLYVWPIPQGGVETVKSDTFRFVPQQSALVLSGEETTTLTPKLAGGKAPINFSLPVPFDGGSVDEKTGVITITNGAVLEQATKVLEERFKRSNLRGQSSMVDALRAEAPMMIEQATRLLGRRPQGVPVAVPIRLTASDANLASEHQNYYVLAEVPSAEFIQRLRKLDEEQSQTMATQPLPIEPQDPVEETGSEDRIAELQRKVDSLEQQVQLLTQQMTLLLRKTQ